MLPYGRGGISIPSTCLKMSSKRGARGLKERSCDMNSQCLTTETTSHRSSAVTTLTSSEENVAGTNSAPARISREVPPHPRQP